MAASLAHAHRVPHTVKPPARCPHCGSTRLIRKGTRRKKLEIAQLWQCKLCRRVFTPAPAELRYKTYPLRVILDGVTLYNLGYSLPEAAAKLKPRHGYRGLAFHARKLDGRASRADDVPPLARAIKDRTYAGPDHSLDANSITARSTASPIIGRSSRCCAKVGSTSASRRSPIFLSKFPASARTTCFSDSSRASQLPPFVNRNHLIVVEKENFATRTAALIIPSVGDNRLRHETLQRFMLANDSVTVAIEIPIWLDADDIDALEIEHGIRLLPEGHEPRVLTGHIDFIQVRNGAVHILDYKPDARTNKPIAQLTLYALALTRLAGLRLFDIKCAWFNEEQYCEFFPRTLL